MHIFKIDKFIVPEAGRTEFMQAVCQTHELLGQQPGLVQQFVLQQVSGPGEFNVVTVVQWENQAAFEQAKVAVQAMHQRSGLDGVAMRERLGIRADLANYQPLEWQ